MTRQEQIEYIYFLYEEKEFVEMILCIREYGYGRFFKDFSGFCNAIHSPIISNMVWNDVMEIYTNEFYSQLWRGLEFHPYGQFDEKKYRRMRNKYFDEFMSAESPLKSKRISDLIK